MPVSVTLPALGESVTEGTVTRWLKQVGEAVAADEPLVEVSTDKVDTEIPAPAGGIVLAIRVPEDTTVAVGTELAVIGDAGALPGDATPAPAPVPAAAPAPAAAAAPTLSGERSRRVNVALPWPATTCWLVTTNCLPAMVATKPLPAPSFFCRPHCGWAS